MRRVLSTFNFIAVITASVTAVTVFAADAEVNLGAAADPSTIHAGATSASLDDSGSLSTVETAADGLVKSAYHLQMNLESGKDGIQEDTWSCGPNSISKLLRYHQFTDATYKKLRQYAEKRMLGLPFSDVKVGTDTKLAAEMIAHWAPASKVSIGQNADIKDIIEQVGKQNPVAVMINWGVFQYQIGTGGVIKYPGLHWMVVNGYNAITGEFTLLDTNGVEEVWSKSEFLERWNWILTSPEYELYMISLIKALGFNPGTYIYMNP